ncbi:MAG: UDP-N-acetylmuramoyl-L-alanyl-D-glutamate--2,6-diaminopimelate ligase [Candidatus Omnitrophica bacterium]|nr:UDP-N-acetylmuramoyl-L-alanyl-D-glutamate--2,6-diaminopimelate ligase [Candidatus Omnitrophota bacterium]
MNEKLKELLKTGTLGAESIKTDSNKVSRGDVFVAIRGTVHDGHDHMNEALASGASFVVCEHDVANLQDEIDRRKLLFCKDTREELGEVASHIYGDPSDTLSVYGVTGTNGKTSTVFLIDSILNKAGRPSGLVSTVFAKVRDDSVERMSLTTPDIMSLNRLLSEMVSSWKQAAAVEISSHALDQKRVWGIKLDSAVFTNITPEHLDYHRDMVTYLADKSKIFDNLKPDGVGVLNQDDPMVIGLRDKIDLPHLVTFGIRENADVRAVDIELSAEGVSFGLVTRDIGQTHVKSSFIGTHNVYNMLAAAAALVKSGLSAEDIRDGLECARPVPGRLETVDSSAPFRIFVDYAHTPNALQSVLECLRPLARSRLICVFGCGGDRDRTKRPVMGRTATRIADMVIITSDNPRSEDPMSIIREIEKGVLNKTNYSIIKQRQDAIREAIRAAKDGDIVVIAGKGHEDCQIIGDQVRHFDDVEVARHVLKESGY